MEAARSLNDAAVKEVAAQSANKAATKKEAALRLNEEAAEEAETRTLKEAEAKAVRLTKAQPAAVEAGVEIIWHSRSTLKDAVSANAAKVTRSTEA